jgi:hypothetical protein
MLLHLEFKLDKFHWDWKLLLLTFSHPKIGQQFVGRPLVTKLMTEFFSPFSAPKPIHRSAPCLLSPPGTPKSSDVAALVRRKFEATRKIAGSE